MIQLTLTHAQNNWLEATWTDVVQAPDVVIPATPEIPAVYEQIPDDMGNLVQGELISLAVPGTPETTTPGAITRTELKHTSYHPTQLDLLQADAESMGTSLDEHAEFLAEWVSSYVPPEPEPEPVPHVLTARQAKRVLLAAGLLDDVDAAVSQADRETQIDWEYATEMRRDWPTLIAMAAALGMTDAQLDELFIQGAKL